MEGVIDLFPEVVTKGIATISNFEFKNDDNPLFNLRAVRDGGMMFYIRDGKYVRLHVNSELVMSDTHLERLSNSPFVTHANGKILIAGLGIGLIVKNILNKESITEITIVEKYQDVIDLVSPKFNDSRIKYICADIFEWKPNKNEKYDTIYFDIWPEISVDNLTEIKKLHNIYKFYINRNNPNHYMNSWMKEYLQTLKRQDRYGL
jgi:hypothetical protein